MHFFSNDSPNAHDVEEEAFREALGDEPGDNAPALKTQADGQDKISKGPRIFSGVPLFNFVYFYHCLSSVLNIEFFPFLTTR